MHETTEDAVGHCSESGASHSSLPNEKASCKSTCENYSLHMLSPDVCLYAPALMSYLSVGVESAMSV